MQRYIEYNNIVLLVIELEFGRVIAFVAVEDQQPIFAFRTRYYIEVEVLDLIQANGIGRPAIIGSCDTLVGWEVVLGIPIGKVVLPGQDNKGRDGPAKGIDSLDHHCPFAVTRLGQLCLATAIRGRNYHTREDNAHYKPHLVEVIGIIIHNTILGLDILYEGKPLANDLWILILGPLVVVSTRITRSEL